jgi:hypothetical protein
VFFIFHYFPIFFGQLGHKSGFSGQAGKKAPNIELCVFSSSFFRGFFGHPFFGPATSAIGSLSFVSVRLQSISRKKKERNKGAPICKLP